MTAVKTIFPELRLAQLVSRSGGLTREAALSRAQDAIETIRGVGYKFRTHPDEVTT